MHGKPSMTELRLFGAIGLMSGWRWTLKRLKVREGLDSPVTRQALTVVSYQGRAPTTVDLHRPCADAL